jgi:hypothetical protein
MKYNLIETAHLDQTYSSPTKRYILLCNTAQTVFEIEGCGCVHGNNKQTTPLGLPTTKALAFAGGGGNSLYISVIQSFNYTIKQPDKPFVWSRYAKWISESCFHCFVFGYKNKNIFSKKQIFFCMIFLFLMEQIS